MLKKKIVPDFSPRKPFIPPAPKMERIQPPTPVVQFAAYVKQAPIPYKNPETPQPISQAFTTAHESPMVIENSVINFAAHTLPLSIPPFSDANSSFSPNIETFTSAGSSYFLTQQQSLNDVAQWASYPAVSDVFMDGFNINALGSLAANNVTITTSSPYSLSCAGNALFQSTIQAQDLTVTSGAIKLTPSHVLETIGGDLFFDTELLAKANDIQQIADWSLYPALSTINMNGNILSNAQQIQTVQLTNASGTFGTAGQYLASDGTKIDWVTPATPGNVGTWATFPASANVDMNTNNITNAQKIQTVQLTNASGTFGSAGEYLTSDGTTINWTTLPPPPAAGVTSVNSAAGVITIVGDVSTITTSVVAGVTTIGAPTLGESTDLTTTCWGRANSASLSATSAGLAAAAADAAALSAQATATSAAVLAAAADGTANLALLQSGVTKVNLGTKEVTIAAGSGIGVVTTFSSGTLDPTITISASGGSGVSSLNTETGVVTITSPTANLVVGSTGAGNIELTVPGGALSSFLSLYSIFVAPNGNDTTGTGSANNPYQTITRAITARALISNTVEVAIQLFPGTYAPVSLGIVLTQNTFLVGIPTGEVNQPVNINAQIVLQGGATGQVGLYGLNLFPALSQCVVINTVGTYNITACNIFNTTNYAIAQSLGTLFLTECRITSPVSGLLPSIGVNSATASLIMRDCLLTSSGTPSIITSVGNLTIRQSNLINTSASATVNPLVNYNPTIAGTSCEISYCTLQYTSAISALNKICVRANPAVGITAAITNCVNNLLLCEGAQSGTGPTNYHCIDTVAGAGPVTLSYGNLLAGATAHNIDSTITKTQYQTVP